MNTWFRHYFSPLIHVARACVVDGERLAQDPHADGDGLLVLRVAGAVEKEAGHLSAVACGSRLDVLVRNARVQAVKAVDAQDNMRAIFYLVYLSSRQCQFIYSSLRRIGCFCSKWFPASNTIHGS